MNFNEIMETAEALLEQNVELENKKNQMETDLLEIIKDNYEKLFLPEIESLLNFDGRLSDKANICFDSQETLFYISRRNGGVGPNLYITNRNNQHDNVFYKTILHKAFSNDYKIHLLSDFTSEESTFAFLASVKEVFARRFEAYASKLRKKNDSLAERIKELAEQLKNSSSVNEKEDGTIEITLNGKTYIGTVKEQ